MQRSSPFSAPPQTRILKFPDWEILPYDLFSPHPDIVSERLATLAELPQANSGFLLVAVDTFLQRLAPRSYVVGRTFELTVGQSLPLEAFRTRLVDSGYASVAQVTGPGEFALRGSLFDVFPMGSTAPLRIDLFDEEIEHIRRFDPDSQRSLDSLQRVRMLPAREVPLDPIAVREFRRRFRTRFEGDPMRTSIYRGVSEGLAPPGVEFYLPLFFEETATLLDYVPRNAVLVEPAGFDAAVADSLTGIAQRYEDRRHDIERPLLPPLDLYLERADVDTAVGVRPRISIDAFSSDAADPGHRFATAAPREARVDVRSDAPLAALSELLTQLRGRVLIAADSPGRREVLQELLLAQGEKIDVGRGLARVPNLGRVARTHRRTRNRRPHHPRSATRRAVGESAVRSARPPGAGVAAGQRAIPKRFSAICRTSRLGPPWCTSSTASGVTSDCRPWRLRGSAESSWCSSIRITIGYTCRCNRFTSLVVIRAPPRTWRRCISSEPINGLKRDGALGSAFATSPRNSWICMRDARRARGLPCRSPNSNTRPSPPLFRSRKPRTRQMRSQRCSRSSQASGRWIGSCAAMSASARPRSPCARPSSPRRRGAKLPCSSPPPYLPNNTRPPSAIASPIGRYASIRCPVFARPRNRRRSWPVSSQGPSTW